LLFRRKGFDLFDDKSSGHKGMLLESEERRKRLLCHSPTREFFRVSPRISS
jgi:hypothetical protein